MFEALKLSKSCMLWLCSVAVQFGKSEFPCAKSMEKFYAMKTGRMRGWVYLFVLVLHAFFLVLLFGGNFGNLVLQASYLFCHCFRCCRKVLQTI